MPKFSSEKDPIRPLFFFFVFSFLALALLFYWTPLAGSYTEVARGLVFSSAPVLAFVTGIFAVKKQGLKTSRGKTLLILTLGIMCWMIGEGLWTYYDIGLHVDPFPSIADLFYVLAYPLFFIGLLKAVCEQCVEFKKVSKVLLFSLFINSLLICLVVAYFGIYRAYTPENSFAENAFALGYGVGDLALIVVNFFVFFMAWEERAKAATSAWFYFFCAIWMTLLGDILFALFEVEHAEKMWPYFQSIDSIWILSYLYFAASFFEFRLGAQEKKSKRFRLLA